MKVQVFDFVLFRLTEVSGLWSAKVTGWGFIFICWVLSAVGRRG